MPPTSEKRRHPRRRVNLPVRSPAAETTPTIASDLSAGGVFLRTHRLHTIGETVELEIPAPPETSKHGTIRATAQVTRVTSEGVGAYFTQLDGDSALLLNLLLAR